MEQVSWPKDLVRRVIHLQGIGRKLALLELCETLREESRLIEGCMFFALFFAPVILLIGVLMLATDVSRYSQDAQRVKNLSVLEATDLQDVKTGEDVVLSGVLGIERSTVSNGRTDKYNTPYGLVIYELERWDVSPGVGGGLDEGRWVGDGFAAPEVITIDGRLVLTGLDKSVEMSGERFYSPIRPGQWRRYAYPHWEGSTRLVGYREGDLVTVFGHKGADGRLVIERLYGGRGETFSGHLESATQSYRLASLIMIGVGLSLGFLGLVIALSPRLLPRVRWWIIDRANRGGTPSQSGTISFCRNDQVLQIVKGGSFPETIAVTLDSLVAHDRMLETKELKQLEIAVSHFDWKLEPYEVCVITRWGKSITLMKTAHAEEALLVKQEIERFLGATGWPFNEP